MEIIIFLIGCIIGFGGIIVSMYQVIVKKSKKFDFGQYLCGLVLESV